MIYEKNLRERDIELLTIGEYSERKKITRQAVYSHIEDYLKTIPLKMRRMSIRNLELIISGETVYASQGSYGLWYITEKPFPGEEITSFKKRTSGKRGPDKKPRMLNERSLLNLLPFKSATIEVMDVKRRFIPK